MKLMTSPKTMLLLEANLEALHEHSAEWMNEIEFWRDELAFFYSLFVKNTRLSVPADSAKLVTNLEKDLLQMIEKDLDDLSDKVREHERYLAALIEEKSQDEKAFRERHKELNHEFIDFERRLKNVKRDAFALYKKTNKES